MRSRHSIAIAVFFFSTSAAALVPVVELATPPADARMFTIMSTAGKHGTSSVWTAPDGSKVAWFLDPDGNNLSLVQFAA